MLAVLTVQVRLRAPSGARLVSTAFARLSLRSCGREAGLRTAFRYDEDEYVPKRTNRSLPGRNGLAAGGLPLLDGYGGDAVASLGESRYRLSGGALSFGCRAGPGRCPIGRNAQAQHRGRQPSARPGRAYTLAAPQISRTRPALLPLAGCLPSGTRAWDSALHSSAPYLLLTFVDRRHRFLRCGRVGLAASRLP